MHALYDAVGKSPTGSRLSKPQLPPFPRNVSMCQGEDNPGTPSNGTQSSSPADTDRSSNLRDSTTSNDIRRGWLYEQGRNASSWTLQYFVLSESILYRYKRMNGTSEIVGNVSSVTRNNDSAGSLGVHLDDGSTHIKVYGETKADTDAWYAALCKASWNSAEGLTERGSFSNQAEELHAFDGFRGWLLKKGQNFKTWKRRYFVLENSRLAYSASANSEVLGSGVVFEVDVGDLRPFCLSIRFQNGRLLHVVAPTEEAFSKWFDVLRRASNLTESFLTQNDGKSILGEEFDNDTGENASDVDVEFTAEDIAEYEMSLRGGEGASLWIAAMQNKPEYDALSPSSSEQGDDKATEAEIDLRASEALSVIQNDSQGCVGWLKKEGWNVKSWKRRYFTLYGSKLSYFKSDKGSLLRSVSIVDVAVHPSISQGLTISTVSGRKLIVQADSEEEFDRWLNAIRGAVAGESDRKSAVAVAPTMNVVMEKRLSGELKSSVSHSGWLQKEGNRFKTWKKRFFTLKNRALIYYSEIGGTARGHGIVKGAHQDDTKPNILVIEFRSGKTMRVSAASEAEMKPWLQAFSQVRLLSSEMTRVSDITEDVVDSEGEGDERENVPGISRFDSSDYLDDSISNDTFMRLRDQEGKATLLESCVDTVLTSRTFKGELTFNEEEEEEKEDMSLSFLGADYYRQLLAEDERVQEQRIAEKLANGEPPITGCAACCIVM